MLARLIALLEGSRLFQLFIITACIQGGVIVSQFLVFPWISPAEVGTIRSVETIIALIVLAGSLGMQSIAVRESSEVDGLALQGGVLQRVYMLIGLTSVVTVLGVCIGYSLLPISIIGGYVLQACGLVLLTNLIRASTAFAQGAKAIREIYFALMLATTVGVLMHVLLTRVYGVHGWVLARYFGEGLCLLVVGWKLRAYVASACDMRHFSWQKLIVMARSGVLVNASLFVRLIVDSLPILLLNYFTLPIDQVGYFGVAMLGLVAGILPVTIIAQRALPELVSAFEDKEKFRKNYALFFRVMLKVSSLTAVLLMLASLIWLFFSKGAYELTALYSLVLALSLPMKAVALSCGTMLLVLRVFGLSLKINIVEGGVVLFTLFSGVPLIGGWAGVIASLVGAACSAGLLLYFLRQRLAEL